MTFWGGSRLAVEGKKLGIVEPFDSDRIDCSAYELTLGAEAYVTPKQGDDLRKNTKEMLSPPQSKKVGGKTRNKGGGTVVIPPGQFALLLTEELISIPAQVMGFISLKLDPKFRGLINVSGFHVDPGFKGCLIFSVYNAGPSAIPLDRGDRLFQLWIADLSGDGFEKYKRTKPGFVGIPSDLISKVSRERHSLQALSDRVDDLKNQVRLYTALAAAVAMAFGLVATAQKLGWFDQSAAPMTPPVVQVTSQPDLHPDLISPTSTARPTKVPAKQPAETHN